MLLLHVASLPSSPLKAPAYWLLGAGWGKNQPLNRSPPIPPNPVTLQVSSFQNKQTFLSTNLAALLDLEQQAVRPLFLVGFFGIQCEAAVVSRYLAAPDFYHHPPTTCRAVAVMEGALGGLWGGHCSWLASPRRGFGGKVPGSWQNRLFRGFSLFLPSLALTANWCVLLQERKRASGWAEQPQDWASPPVRGRANISFEHKVLFGLFLSVGSDVCLTLRTVCEHWVSFGHFIRWFWGVSDAEGSFCWGHVCLELCIDRHKVKNVMHFKKIFIPLVMFTLLQIEDYIMHKTFILCCLHLTWMLF